MKGMREGVGEWGSEGGRELAVLVVVNLLCCCWTENGFFCTANKEAAASQSLTLELWRR